MSQEIKRLISQRAYKKGLITQDLKALDKLEQKDLSFLLLDQYISNIEKNLEIIEEFDARICEDMEESELQVVLTSARTYHMDISVKIVSYKSLRDKLSTKTGPIPSGSTTGKTVKLPLPPIQLQPFQNNLVNPFAYYSFKKSFSNAIAGMPDLTESQKLIYLKGYLTGEAFNLVENLPIQDDSFKLAIQLLDSNFLDKDLIIDKTLNSILNAPEVGQLKDVETFVRMISNKVQDLKGVGVDLTTKDSSGLLLLSKIINLKLPRAFSIELSRETNSNYPNFNQLIEKYQEIIVRLRLGSLEQGTKPKVKFDSPNSSIGVTNKWDTKKLNVDTLIPVIRVKIPYQRLKEILNLIRSSLIDVNCALLLIILLLSVCLIVL